MATKKKTKKKASVSEETPEETLETPEEGAPVEEERVTKPEPAPPKAAAKPKGQKGQFAILVRGEQQGDAEVNRNIAIRKAQRLIAEGTPQSEVRVVEL